MNKKKGLIIAVSIILSLSLVTIGTVVIIEALKPKKQAAEFDKVEDGNGSSFKKETSGENTIESIAKKTSNSVVSIVATNKKKGFLSNASSAGTGVIVTKNGYIITNKHVIKDMDKISVVLNDGTNYDTVKVVAKDPLNDIAYLKIENVDNLSAAELGDSKTIHSGQEVIAIGNALGQYHNTITRGIISGTNRSVDASDGHGSTESLNDMIQTDAAINSGNSGGPLLNAKGQVIGINTAIASDAHGVGFAIPIGATKGMLKSLIEKGVAQRATLGVNYVQITPAIAKERDLPVKKGAYLYSPDNEEVVKPNSAASKAGLLKGDIITKVSGIEVGEMGSISSLISEFRPGDEVKLNIIRNGKDIEVKAILDGVSR